MEFNIEINDLKDAMKAAMGTVPKRTVVPIMANVLIATDEESVNFIASDLDSEVRLTKPAQVKQQGAITVPAQMLTDIAAKLPSGALVKFSLKDDHLAVSAGRSRFKLRTLPVDDFPEMATSDFDVTLDIDGSLLARCLSRCRVAASTEETRYYLNGVAMQPYEGGIRFVATDGHRLVSEYMDGPDIPSIIIPLQAVTEIGKLADGVEQVSLSLSESMVKLEAGGSVFVSKTIEGTFPDWSRIVPGISDNLLTADAVEVATAAARVATVSSERSKSVRIKMDSDKVTLSVGAGGDTASDEVEATYSGNDGDEIGINARYLADMMGLAEKGGVTMSIRSAGEAMLIKFDESPDTIAVCMPMRI